MMGLEEQGGNDGHGSLTLQVSRRPGVLDVVSLQPALRCSVSDICIEIVQDIYTCSGLANYF
jgi:hypothetical protein